jgi:putative cardiolipin synthase
MHAKLQIVLNAVEKGSNPWGCTDYLNQKKKILETGVDVHALLCGNFRVCMRK